MADQPAWNPSDKDGDVTLSNGNRTWQQVSGTVGAVRSAVGLSSGRWRVQLTQITANGSACRHGFATASHALATAPGNSAQSWAINGQGSLEHGGATGSDYANFANGAVVQLYVDIDAGRIWYGDASGPLAGDPAAGTGAMHSVTPGTTLYLAGGMDGGGSSRGGTLRLLADYTGTPPAGFTDGWGGGAVGVELAAGGGAVAAVGRTATLRAGIGVRSPAGSTPLAVAGAAGAVATGVTPVAATGPLAVAGPPPSVAAGQRLAAGAGLVGVAGGTALVDVAGGLGLAAGLGRCLVAGAAAALVAGQVLAAAAAPMAVAGHPATVRAGAGWAGPATAATLALAAGPAAASGGVRPEAAAGPIFWSGAPASLASGQRVAAAAAAVVVLPGEAALRAGARLLPADAAVAATGPGAARVTAGAGVGTAAGGIAMAGHPPGLPTAAFYAGIAGSAGAVLPGGRPVVVAGAPVRAVVPPPGDLDALLATPTTDLDWVAVIEPWDAGAAAVVPLRWSTRDFTTAPGASLPNTRIPGRLADVQLRQGLWAGNELFGRSQPAGGVVVLENADGALTHLGTATTASGGRRWHFRRRTARILLGHPAWGWDDYRPVFTGEIEQEEFADGRLTLALRDRLRRLDQPLQGAVFRGDRVLLASASPALVGTGARSFLLPDLVANGGFATSLAGWDAGTGWAHAAGRAAKTPGVASAVAQDVATAPDTAYRIRADVERTAGTLLVTVDGEPLGDAIAASGVQRPTFVARGTTTRVAFVADAAFTGSVDGVSIRAEPAAQVGDAVRIARSGDLAGTWMAGLVAGWTEAGGELAVAVAEAVGEGTHADWSIWLRPEAGPAEMAAKNVPMAFGSVRHAAPADLGSVQGLWLHRLADTGVRVDPTAGHGVFDGGVALDLADAFPPAAGQAFVDAADGALWVASRPQFPLTATFAAGLGATAAARAFAAPGRHLFRVPAGVTALRARLWGAGGGHGGIGDTGFPGGGGGFVDATMTVQPGELLAVAVPAGGGAGQGGSAGGAAGLTGAAAAGGAGGLGTSRAGGGGGGAAGILRDGALVLLAPGGGGGSGEAAGGPGGGTSGTDGGDGGARHGNGGTATAGGSGGSGQGSGSAGGAGTSAAGGPGGAGSTSGGGGGGGGYHGGGGGGAGLTGGAGAGGAAMPGGGATEAGSGATPGGAADPGHVAGVGAGGADGAAGGPGRVVLSWTPDGGTAATAAGLLEALLRDRAGFRHLRAGPEILVSIAADAASRTLVAGGGSFLALGIRPGDQVSLAGAGPNLGTGRTVATVADTTLGLVEPVADQAPTTDFVLTAGDLDQPALAALAALCPQPVGLRLGEESPTGRDLLDRIAAGVGAWIDATPAGHLTAGRYAGPAAVADHALDPRHLLAPPRRVAAGPALWRRRIGARRCWRVHGPAEIAAAASEAVRAFLLQEWREGFAEDAAVRTADPGAEEVFVEGLFDRREDAAAEAARQLALRSPDALAFQVETTLRALPWRLGRTVALTCPEAGLAQPRRMVLLARDVRLADDRVTLTLLG
jgi:hypothetical protein